jgi:hypothetical protein
MLPRDAVSWLDENMKEYYPLGVFKDAKAEEPQEVA